jgi:hypothetical protein
LRRFWQDVLVVVGWVLLVAVHDKLLLVYRSDVYSFGVILWELATLQQPWAGMNPIQVNS